MSSWESRRTIDLTLFAPIKLLFEKNAVSRMYDLRNLHSGKIADMLGINGGRYAEKLAHPEKFTFFEILRFSYLVDVDPNLIINVIQNEADIIQKVQERVKSDLSKTKSGSAS
jgi:hypothetical protein